MIEEDLNETSGVRGGLSGNPPCYPQILYSVLHRCSLTHEQIFSLWKILLKIVYTSIAWSFPNTINYVCLF